MTEHERLCGWRYCHSPYLVGAGLSVPCDRLPWNLTVCPVCGSGLRVTRAPQNIDAEKLLGPHVFREEGSGSVNIQDGDEVQITGTYDTTKVALPSPIEKWVRDRQCPEFKACPICDPAKMKSAFLFGVGRRYYTPESFIKEARKLGVSKRISAIPRNLKIGETWILLTHPDAGVKNFQEHDFNLKTDICECGVRKNGSSNDHPCIRKVPAIFYAFRPERVEFLVWKSEATPEKIQELENRGLTVIIVEDGGEKHKEAKRPARFKKSQGMSASEFQKVLG